MRRASAELLPALVVLVLALALAGHRELRRARDTGTGPERAGERVERCLRCHTATTDDPGGAHSAAALGCSTCHLGNRWAYDRDRAHAGMEPEPGALATAERTCGQDTCHARELTRVRSSLMTTGAGIIAVNRWVFGEQPTPDGHESFADLLAAPQPSPAQDHLRKLCAGCHLGARAANRDDAIDTRGSGCAACHLRELAPDTPTEPADGARPHPAIDGRVDDTRCTGCHSRSGRISLSYRGLAALGEPADPRCTATRALADGRTVCELEPDVHQRAGMACIDCHLHNELMGDGTRYAHAEQQVEIACESCHATERDELQREWPEITDPITRAILRARGETEARGGPVRTGRRGTPLWNLQRDGDRWLLRGKLDGATRPSAPTPRDADHQLAGHERLGCAACHTAWTPICASCHVDYDPGGEQWDFAAAAVTRGAWRERPAPLGWGPPPLAVLGERAIVPATPGMILTIGGEIGQPPRSRRLFAPLSPHTIQKRSRTCASCHRSPLALGLGDGELRLEGERPTLVAHHPDPATAQRGADGWTELLAAEPAVGTRRELRSFDGAEQRAILRVGLCLPCHERADDPIYRAFDAATAHWQAGSRCPAPVPTWLNN